MWLWNTNVLFYSYEQKFKKSHHKHGHCLTSVFAMKHKTKFNKQLIFIFFYCIKHYSYWTFIVCFNSFNFCFSREAARECRRKKKEYIKCLENRVAVLENQNKALIDELKALKELYCQQKTEWIEFCAI